MLCLIVDFASLFTKLLWPGVSEETFRSSSQTAICPPVTIHGGGFFTLFLQCWMLSRKAVSINL